MSDKTTMLNGLTLRGIVEPDEARKQRRKHFENQLARAQEALARDDATIEVSYWQGNRRLHPACEDRPEAAVPRQAGWTPLGDDRGLLIEAAEWVVKNQFASPSSLQRGIRVGFAEAGWLLNLLEERGIVGEAKGSAAREVLAPKERLAGVVNALRAEDDAAVAS